jgi:DNA-directed RNA polymerase specialized sigma24 family protein
VQEVFVRAVDKPRRFAAVDNQEAWLRTVALRSLPSWACRKAR